MRSLERQRVQVLVHNIQHTHNEGEVIYLDEVDEEDDKNFDCHMLNDDDDYILYNCIVLLMLGIEVTTYHSSAFL